MVAAYFRLSDVISRFLSNGPWRAVNGNFIPGNG